MSSNRRSQNGPPSESEREEGISTKAKAVIATLAALVSIATGILTLGSQLFPGDDDSPPANNGFSDTPTDLGALESATLGTVEIYGERNEQPAGGSGFVYDAGPPVRILTTSHVIEGITGLQVKVGEQPAVPAQVVARAPCDDVAVLELSSPPDEVAALTLGDSDAIETGARVTALGYASDFRHAKQQTVGFTDGRVSNPDVAGQEISADLPQYSALIQHSAALEQGNSGGPLVNPSGEAVGINTLPRAPGEQRAYYAIGINAVRNVLPGLEAGINRAYLGWSIAPLDIVPPPIRIADYMNSYGFGRVTAEANVEFDEKELDGLYILANPEVGSPTDQKVYGGDLIVKIDGASVKSVDEVCRILETKAPGDTIRISGVGLTSPAEYTPEFDKTGFSEDIALSEEAVAAPE